MNDLDTSVSMLIHAPVQEVWKALTTPEMIKRWFFGVETETDWTPGSSIVHRGEYQGKPAVDKGTIIRFASGALGAHPLERCIRHARRTGALSGGTWALAELEGATELTISEHNLPSEEAKDVSEQGWKAAIEGLKALLEEGST